MSHEIRVKVPGEGTARVTVGANGFDQGKAIVRVSFQHDAIIDEMLKRPRIEQKELAEMFGYSCGWMNRLVNSDAFKARIAQRKAELVDPGVARRLNARIEGVTIQAINVIARKLDSTDSAELALQALGITSQVDAKRKARDNG